MLESGRLNVTLTAYEVGYNSIPSFSKAFSDYFGISRENIEKFLTDRGFSNIVSVSSDYFNTAYFTGVNQDRESTPVLSIAHAQIQF